MDDGNDGNRSDRIPPRPSIFGSVFGQASEPLENIIRRRNPLGAYEADGEVAEGDNQQQMFVLDDHPNRNNDEVMDVDDPNADVLPQEEARPESPAVVEDRAVEEENAVEQEEAGGNDSFNYDFHEDRFLENLHLHQIQAAPSTEKRRVPTADASVQADETQRAGSTTDRDTQCTVDSQDVSTQMTVPSRSVHVETIAITSREVGVQLLVDVMENGVQTDTVEENRVETVEKETQYEAPFPTSVAELYTSCLHNKGFMEGFSQGVRLADAHAQNSRTGVPTNPLDLLSVDMAARSLTSYQTPPDFPQQYFPSLTNQDGLLTYNPLLMRNMLPTQQLSASQNAHMNRHLYSQGIDYSNLSPRQFGLHRPTASSFLFNSTLHPNGSPFGNQQTPDRNLNLFPTTSVASPLQSSFNPQATPGNPVFPNSFLNFDARQVMTSSVQGSMNTLDALHTANIMTNPSTTLNEVRMTPPHETAMAPNAFPTLDQDVAVNQRNAREVPESPESPLDVNLVVPQSPHVHFDDAPQNGVFTSETSESGSEDVSVVRNNSPEVLNLSGRPVRTCQKVRMATPLPKAAVAMKRTRSSSTVSTGSNFSVASRPKKRRRQQSKSSAPPQKPKSSLKKPAAPKPKQSRKESDSESETSDEEEEKNTTPNSRNRILKSLSCSLKNKRPLGLRRKP